MDGEVCGGAAFLLVSPLLPVPPLLCQSVIFPPLPLSSVCGHPFVGSVYMAFFRRMREEGTDRSFRQKKGEKMPSELLLSLFRSPFSLSAKNKHSDGGGVGKVRRDAAVFHYEWGFLSAGKKKRGPQLPLPKSLPLSQICLSSSVWSRRRPGSPQNDLPFSLPFAES